MREGSSPGASGIERHWEATGELFRCLSSPVRVGIIAQLLDGARTVGNMVDALGVSQPLVSQHLKVLREHCLVDGDKDGRRTLYRLMDDHVGHIVADAISHIAEHDHPRDAHPTRTTDNSTDRHRPAPTGTDQEESHDPRHR